RGDGAEAAFGAVSDSRSANCIIKLPAGSVVRHATFKPLKRRRKRPKDLRSVEKSNGRPVQPGFESVPPIASLTQRGGVSSDRPLEVGGYKCIVALVPERNQLGKRGFL